eukprot:XP_001700143.1 predicted protein [Chlamydomonas reinhardtii]
MRRACRGLPVPVASAGAFAGAVGAACEGAGQGALVPAGRLSGTGWVVGCCVLRCCGVA